MVAAIMMFCAIRFEAQSVKLVETLPDGTPIFEMNGKEWRGIDADKAREIQKLRVDLEAAKRVNQEKDSQIAAQAQEIQLLKKDVEIVGLQRDSFKADFERSQADAKRNYDLFIGERTLRQESSQFIPKGNSHGFWGKTLDFLNSQAGQVGFKLIIPTAQAVKVFSARCP